MTSDSRAPGFLRHEHHRRLDCNWDLEHANISFLKSLPNPTNAWETPATVDTAAMGDAETCNITIGLI